MQQAAKVKTLNAPGLFVPKNPYSHVASVTGAATVVTISGQLGLDSDGRVVDGFQAQVRLALDNLKAALSAAGMSLEHAMHLRHYLVAGQDIAVFNQERVAVLGDLRPASTLIFVSGLANANALYEVDAIAAA